MSRMEILFTASNLLVLPFWFLMIVLPRWRWTQRILQSTLVLLPFLILYTILALPLLGELWPILLDPQLNTVAAVLGKPEVAAAGWIHYLAFDLFVGRWEFFDGQRRGLSAWLMGPALLLTLLLGPLGLLLYLGFRAFSKGQEQAPLAAIPR
jgi:hypothetical protein